MRYSVFKAYLIIHIFSLPYWKLSAYENVYDVKDIKNIEFIAEFPEYDDVVAYGEKPNCINPTHVASPFLDWDDPESYQIRSPKKVYVAKLPDGSVSARCGGTMFQGNQCLLFSISWLPKIKIFPYCNKEAGLQITNRFKKLACVAGPHKFFYHNIIDRLPTIMLLRDTIMKQDSNVKLLIPQSRFAPKYFYDYLKLLGIHTDRLELADKVDWYAADELYFATPFAMEPIPKNLLLKLRNELIEASAKEPLSRPYKHNLIVVIQREEANRRLENIDELLELLKTTFAGKDYEILVFKADQSVAEQIQIFNHAKIVIGLMSSGMTNIIYARPGTIIIDIRPETLPHMKPSDRHNHGLEWIWWLSSACNLNYWFILHNYLFSDALVKCPIDALKKTLYKMRLV